MWTLKQRLARTFKISCFRQVKFAIAMCMFLAHNEVHCTTHSLKTSTLWCGDLRPRNGTKMVGGIVQVMVIAAVLVAIANVIVFAQLLTAFRQQLLHGTICLTDASKLDELVDVQLVLLDSHGTSMPDKRAIMAAACQGDVSALEALLQRRLDPDIVAVYYREEDEDEDFECSVLLETPLDKSVDGGHVGCTRLLLEACAGTVTFSEITPLPLVRACRQLDKL